MRLTHKSDKFKPTEIKGALRKLKDLGFDQSEIVDKKIEFDCISFVGLFLAKSWNKCIRTITIINREQEEF